MNKKNKNTIWIIFAVVVLVLVLILFLKGNGDYETFEVRRADFINSLSISGKVVPAQSVDMTFEVSGKISSINADTGDKVKKGDVLVTLDSSEVDGEIGEVVADVQTEQAKLSEISGDTTSQNKIQNISETVLNTFKKAYINADDVVKNSADNFIENPNGRFPEFSVVLGDYFLRQEINDSRYDVGKTLDEWKIKIDSLIPENITSADVSYSINNLKKIEDFLAKISSDVDEFSPIDSISQTQIDAYITNISNARTKIASLIVEVNETYNDLRDVFAEIPVIQSSINNAEASVQKLYAKKNKYVLRAPFDGVITKQDIELGQIVSPDYLIISLISNEPLQVEGFVPELNIFGLNIGDSADLIFDALGRNLKIKAAVSHIDPRETIKDGITTYRILLDFVDINEEVRSGMTNDIEIEKERIDDQIIVPRYLISSDSEGEYVEILKENKKEKRYVDVGEKDNKGGVIILNGLNAGEKIIVTK